MRKKSGIFFYDNFSTDGLNRGKSFIPFFARKTQSDISKKNVIIYFLITNNVTIYVGRLLYVHVKGVSYNTKGEREKEMH